MLLYRHPKEIKKNRDKEGKLISETINILKSLSNTNKFLIV